MRANLGTVQVAAMPQTAGWGLEQTEDEMPPRSTSSKQDHEFAKMLVEEMSLDAGWVLDWVQENFPPEEIYDADELEEWALEHGWRHEA